MIRQLLENARQRLLYNQLAAQFTFAVSLVLGALILLLLAGTQILDWRILAVLIACGGDLWTGPDAAPLALALPRSGADRPAREPVRLTLDSLDF